jgi:hypothetical protein
MSIGLVADVTRLDDLRLRDTTESAPDRSSLTPNYFPAVEPTFLGLGAVRNSDTINVLLSDGQVATFEFEQAGFTVPLWPVVLLLPMPLAVKMLSLARRSARARNGSCAICGYDLRATPSRCPECGTPTGLIDREDESQSAPLTGVAPRGTGWCIRRRANDPATRID